VPAEKKSTKKRSRAKSGDKRKRTKKVRQPMSKDFHTLAAEVVGFFTTGVIARGGSVSARDSKSKDAVQVTAKVGDEKLALRIAQR